MKWFEDLTDYFTDLGFYQDTLLGNKGKTVLWTLMVYILVSLGVFCRQITQVPEKVDLKLDNLKWSVFITSLIVGFAILPYVIKKINKTNSIPGFQQTLSAFGIGFFVDLADTELLRFFHKA